MIKVRRVKKGDLSRMREVVESAFGDFFERQLGTRPRQVFGGAQYVHHRWLMEPGGCFGGGLLGDAGSVRARGRADAVPEPEGRAAARAGGPELLRREPGDTPGRRH